MGIKTIKTLNLETSNCKEYNGLCNNQKKWEMRKHYLIQYMWRMIDLINIIAIGVLFYLSYNEYLTLSISYGGLYLFFMLFDKCLYSVGMLADNF